MKENPHYLTSHGHTRLTTLSPHHSLTSPHLFLFHGPQRRRESATINCGRKLATIISLSINYSTRNTWWKKRNDEWNRVEIDHNHLSLCARSNLADLCTCSSLADPLLAWLLFLYSLGVNCLTRVEVQVSFLIEVLIYFWIFNLFWNKNSFFNFGFLRSSWIHNETMCFRLRSVMFIFGQFG